jgi:hypothetical protein
MNQTKERVQPQRAICMNESIFEYKKKDLLMRM